MNDETLEGLLRQAILIFDPVPPHLVQTAVEAFVLTTLEDELAELTFDSLTEAAPVRDGDHPRLLTFSGAGVTLDLELTPRRLIGQVLPPEAAELELLGPTPLHLSTDALGRFTHDDVPSGPFALRCSVGETVITTEWVTVR